MLRSVDMQDYMMRNPVTVSKDMDIYEAINQILVNQVSGICVTDEQNTLIGVLSEMDCLRAILSSVYNESPRAGTVEEFMTAEVISVSLSDSIVDVATDMLKHKHRRRPVIDENGKLLGQVSCRQLLRAVQEFATPQHPPKN